MVFDTNSSGRITFANLACLNVLGMDIRILIRDFPFMTLVSKKEADPVETAINNTAERDWTQGSRIYYGTKSGFEFPALIHQ